MRLHIDDAGGVQPAELGPCDERRLPVFVVWHTRRNGESNGREAVVYEQRSRNGRQALPRVVETQANRAARKFPVAACVRRDFVGRQRPIPVLGKVAKLGFEILTRFVVKMKDGKKRSDRPAEHECGKPPAEQVETAPQRVAALGKWPGRHEESECNSLTAA